MADILNPLFITIFQIEDIDLRLMGHSVHGKNQLKVYHKDLFWCLSYSIYFLMTFLLKETEICDYADDKTVHVCGHELEQIVSSFKLDARKLSKWFFDNKMKLIPNKGHLLISVKLG